jgi:hypothetical protein
MSAENFEMDAWHSRQADCRTDLATIWRFQRLIGHVAQSETDEEQERRRQAYRPHAPKQLLKIFKQTPALGAVSPEIASKKLHHSVGSICRRVSQIFPSPPQGATLQI